MEIVSREVLFKKLKNPLDNEETINQILDIYINCKNFYNGITEENSNSETRESFIYKDILFKYIFDKWKKSVIYTAENKLLQEDQETICFLAQYLSKIKAKNSRDAFKYSDESYISNPKLKKSLKKYTWNQPSLHQGFIYINSNLINCSKDKAEIIEHKLYINCELNKLHLIVYEFIKRCSEQGIDYYIKFRNNEITNSPLLIYSNNQNICKHIEILENIIDEYNLDKSINNTSILTGKITKHIGYTSASNKANYSFNKKRAAHLLKCIREETKHWILSMLNKRIVTPSGNLIQYKKYLIEQTVNYIRSKLEESIDNTPQQYMGYSLNKEDIYSYKFEKNIEERLLHRFSDIMDYISNPTRDFIIYIPTKWLNIEFRGSDIEKILKEQTAFFRSNYPEYKQSLLNRIKKTANDYEIDKDNYAFDISKANIQGFSSVSKINKISPTSNIKQDESYNTKHHSSKRGAILEKRHKPKHLKEPKIKRFVKSILKK